MVASAPDTAQLINSQLITTGIYSVTSITHTLKKAQYFLKYQAFKKSYFLKGQLTQKNDRTNMTVAYLLHFSGSAWA